MLEDMFSEFLKMIVLALSLIILVFFFQLFVTLNRANDFKTQVNSIIEREGGLTNNALLKIDKYNADYYDGQFSIKSSQLGDKLEFGEEVFYEVISDNGLKVPFSEDEVWKIKAKGTAVVLVK